MNWIDKANKKLEKQRANFQESIDSGLTKTRARAAAHAGKKASEETKAKISESGKGNNRALGYKHKSEAKQQISEFQKGRSKSEETKANMSAAQKGRVNSKEARDKISKSLKKLTLDQVAEIRSKYIPWKYSSRKLAKEYGVTSSTILRIIQNKSY